MIRTNSTPLFSFLLPLLFLLPFCAPPAGPQQASAGEVDLKSEIDKSIRWLRSKQVPGGSYGVRQTADGNLVGDVRGTTWALQALASCPRKYTRRDGPFVSKALEFLQENQGEKGGIHDPDAKDEIERTTQSVLAWLALSQYDDEQSVKMRKRLEGFFATPPKPQATQELSAEAARATSAELLASRKPNDLWIGTEGSVVATSKAIVELSRCHDALQKKSGKAAGSGNARRLPPFDAADRSSTVSSLQKGALFLIYQSKDGLWGPGGNPEAGTTAMALGALQELPEPRPKEVQEVIDRGLAWLAGLQDEDGAIHDGKLKNYLTSASVLALAKSGDEKYQPVIEKARKFLVALQADEGEGYTDGDLFYGGIGYGGDERPDLSNLQMALEALAASGTEQGDESFKRALKFLERVQNRSESNDVRIEKDGKVIRSGDDGGASYAPGDSKAGFDELPDGTKVPRSYGSMTYALLKGFIFAGLPRDDPRMQAAWKWIREHYTLEVNPGFELSEDPTAAYQGLFYYFHTMAKALDLYGEEVIVDGEGREHPWRKQLCGRLIAMQRKDDGSWVNENAPRWWEGDPVLATSYAMLTLGAAMPKVEAQK